MKPLGTITKYYPFIDDESKSLLDSLMAEASSYYDFVLRLVEVVLEDDVPDNVAYLAAVHAWWCRTEENTRLVQDRFGDLPYIRPWGFPYLLTPTDPIRHHDAVVEAIEKALESSLGDWMDAELHLLHTTFHWPGIGDVPSFIEPLERARVLVEANPALKCFESLVCGFQAWAKAREFDLDDALDVFQKAKELAGVYDDSIYKYMNLLNEAVVLRGLNVQDSLARYEELYELVLELEVPYLIAEVLMDSATANLAAGEYDLAIAGFLKALKIVQKDDTTCLHLSTIYSILGDGHHALEWAERAFEYAGKLEFAYKYIVKARALVVLNRLEETQHNLDTAHSLILKSGKERHLGQYYRISGALEIARGNYPEALDLLVRSWEIAERNPRVVNQNMALLDLARVELILAGQSRDSVKSVTPGSWLQKLERHATERDLPGIRMQAALFMSEFYQNHGQLKDAIGTLEDALVITDSLGVKTLRERINDRISELNQLLKEA